MRKILRLLNVFLTITIIFSEYVYLSYYPIASWHENSGTQFLAILLISLPIFFMFMIIYYILGKRKKINKVNEKLPMAATIIFVVPILLDDSLSPILITVGSVAGFNILLVSVYFIFVVRKDNND